MAISIHPFLGLLDRLLDWFIPADIAADREMRKQARMFLISHLLGPFIGNVVPGALFLFDPTPGYEVAVLAVSITGFWIFPFVLRSFGHYNLLAIISIQNLIFCILWSCYFYGGVTSPTLPWVLTIPLLAFFYVGSSPLMRSIVLAVFAVNAIIFTGVYMGFPPPDNDMPFAALQGLGLVSTIAASLYVTMMAIVYAKALASQGELHSEMKGHLQTATELRRATEQAERAGAAKAEFLAKMSHELRTPLNAVIGYSEILLEDAADEGDAESAADLVKIHTAGKHLLKLVNEVLDLSKIEAGKMEMFNEAVDLASLVQTVAETSRQAAQKHGNAIAFLAGDGVGTIQADACKVQQVLMQLIENAIKFTRDGQITIAVQRLIQPRGDVVRVEVRDTGIGIAPQQIPLLFEQFAVFNDSSASKYGGTGLGLALSQRLCALMGGALAVESTLGQGTCFSITIPAQPPVQPVALHPDTEVSGHSGSNPALDLLNLSVLAFAQDNANFQQARAVA